MSDTREIAPGGAPADLLTPDQAAEILRKSLGTLSRWRTHGIGPSYIKNGGTVEYRRSDLEEYRERQRRLVPAQAVSLAQ
jgi:predicted site-specific integrase-resolvase